MVITLAGDNQFAKKAAADTVVADFVAANGDLAVERFEAVETEAEHILSALSGGSLFASEKLVVIADYEVNKGLADQTDDILARAGDTMVLIILGKPDKRATYFKTLKAKTDYREFGAAQLPELITWLLEIAQDKGGQLDRSAAQYLIEYVGTDQNRLSNELDKLVLYDPKVSRATIELLCEKEITSTIFELLDAGFAGQHDKALKLYNEQRRQQVEPQAILSMIAWQLHILAIVKMAGPDRTPATVAKGAGVHPFVVQKSMRIVQGMTRDKLRQLVRRVIELEIQLKSQAMQPDDAVQQLLLTL